jgi:hypothetical protein
MGIFHVLVLTSTPNTVESTSSIHRYISPSLQSLTMKMTCQHKLSVTLPLLMTASSSCDELFVASSLRWRKTPSSTSPCSFCHHHQLPHRRRRCHGLSAVGSDDAPPQYSSISHDHNYNSRERAAKFVRKNGRDKNELMMGGIVRGVSSSSSVQ